MRVPTPAALLVEHPVVPVPNIDGVAVECRPLGEPLSGRALSRREKFNAALQLTAAASLLAEFELWPGTAAVRNAFIVRSSSGVQACLSRFPVPMSPVFARLGGGEAAAATIRTALLSAVSDAVELPPASIDVAKGEPGFFLEGAISRQLGELKLPLDRCTARALWAFRWDALPVPEKGMVSYWNVPIPELARRLGGALWANIRRQGGDSWLRAAGDDEGNKPPLSETGGHGILILVGEISPSGLSEVSSWMQVGERSAVVIGTFPRGWHPPHPPGFEADHLHRHLAVTGMSLEDARRVVERRAGRIDPFQTTDRRALTDGATKVFAAVSESAVESVREPEPNRLRDVLALSPDGLPPHFVTLHSGLTRRALEEERRELVIVESGKRWRLVDGPPLEPDPLHVAVSDLYDRGDPKRLLHHALGTGNTADLETWARTRLDNLDGFSVRDLLSMLSPGALGHEIGMLLAEACLAVYDISGARRAIAAIPADRSLALATWLDGIDDPPGQPRELPEPAQLEISPRAVAESAILVLNEHRRRGRGRADEARALIDRANPRVSDLLRRRFEIELAWIADAGELEDPAWRRRVVGDHPVLRFQFAHRRAVELMDRGQTRAALRLLGLLNDDRAGPGISGAIALDLGAAALDAGRSREADAHQLRAFRLLQAAGFRHLTRRVLFNLAVGDVDQLEIRRAQERFDELAKEDPDDPYVCGELARLALARGDLQDFRKRLREFSDRVADDDPRFAEALRLLRGVEALFDGELARAHSLLRDAGQEGEAWCGLVDTMAGREMSSWQMDSWGVSTAAELISEGGSDGAKVASLLSDGKMTRSRAVGVALAEQVTRARLPIEEKWRGQAIRALRSAAIDGWADVLALGSGREAGIVEALADIVEGANPEQLTPDLAQKLLAALGVDGLELRDAADDRTLWRIGEGSPGTELRRGRIVVVPLGGETHEGPAWRLLASVFELFAPAHSAPSEPEIEATGFYGISEAATVVRRALYELGPTHLPILLLGETGVGKEVAARALHRLSGRRGSFVPVNVAAIPAALLEAELFGSVKGAFTGADRSRQGLTVAADQGTLFLDEVGDLDPPLQVKLLRFLEDQEVRPIGATRSRKVDVRIISATHRNLDRNVREGGFRQDLYYRIAALPLEIPPLRERREDIGLLRDLFERHAAARHGLEPCTWSRDAQAMLRRHRWPGNVRELRQAVEVALVRAGGAVVRPEHLPFAETDTAPIGTWDDAQREFRYRFLRAALARNNGNRSATARELGISRQALLYHIKNLRLVNSGDS